MFSWHRDDRTDSVAIEDARFEDHTGTAVTFREFFRGAPSIVTFFYTRCDNPLKCSLTMTKLGRVQAMLAERGVRDRIRTAAVTYDPGFDSAERMRRFGLRRGCQLGANHRMLRATTDMRVIQRHFRLGVNFIESLVNRHQIEVYVLDAEGRIAFSFERLRWEEDAIVTRAIDVLNAPPANIEEPRPAAIERRTIGLAVPAIALALLPKCPVCWATYLSALGVIGLERTATLARVEPALLAGTHDQRRRVMAERTLV